MLIADTVAFRTYLERTHQMNSIDLTDVKTQLAIDLLSKLTPIQISTLINGTKSLKPGDNLETLKRELELLG